MPRRNSNVEPSKHKRVKHGSKSALNKRRFQISVGSRGPRLRKRRHQGR